jgi:hypothetical protein
MYEPFVIEFLGTAFHLGAVAFTHDHLLFIASLAIAISVAGRSSQGYFNPAITAMQLASGKISQNKALVYFLAQFTAALFVWLVSSVIKV